MTSQVLSTQPLAVRAFVSLLRAHASATRQLNAQLSADHGLTISDYEVLLRLGAGTRSEDATGRPRRESFCSPHPG